MKTRSEAKGGYRSSGQQRSSHRRTLVTERFQDSIMKRMSIVIEVTLRSG